MAQMPCSMHTRSGLLSAFSFSHFDGAGKCNSDVAYQCPLSSGWANQTAVTRGHFKEMAAQHGEE